MATRKDIKKAEELRISQIGDFKKRLGGIQELPSGLIVRIKNPGGLKSFIGSGQIPNSLMIIIDKGIKSGQAPQPAELMPEGKIDPKLLEDMNTLLNVITMGVIVEPKINPIPENEDDRLDTELYVDEIPEDDKQFLFQWISGGTRDLEIFRKQLDASLDAVAAESVVGTIAKRDNGVDQG